MRLGHFKIFQYIIITLLWLCPLLSPAALIKGTITTEKEGAAAFSVVAIKENGKSFQADKEGHYRIGNLQPGDYTLSYFYSGFKKLEKKVKIIGANDTIRVDAVLEAISSELGEVVVSGTMKETYLTESAVHVEVLTPKLFQKNPTPSIFDALQMVNGVRPQINCNVCNTGDIHINGMEGPYTMVLIDGMPIVSSLSTVYGLSGIPNSIVERIEVVKGPASTLYGSEAVAGLINIITKNPLMAPRFSIDFFSSSQWEKNLDISYAIRKGKFSSLLSGNLFHFNNRLDVNHDNFTDATLQKRASLFSKSSIALKGDKRVNIGLRYLYEDRFGGELQWERKFRGGDSVYGESIYTKRFELIGQAPLWKSSSLSWSYNFHKHNSAYGSTWFIASQHVAFVQLTNTKRLSPRHEVLSGITARYTYYDDNTVITQSPDSIAVNRPSRSALPGVFIQEEYSVSEKLRILSGIRLDHHQRHGFIVSPRINIKYDLDKYNTFRLGMGNGYRVVNLFTEEHSALTGSRNIIIKNELKPEQSWNATLNYTCQVNYKGGYAGLDFSAFYTHFLNKISGDFLSDPNAIIYDNLNGFAITRGFAVNSNFHFVFPLKVTMGSTFMQVYRVENGVKQTQIQAPGYTGNFVISYSFRKSRISLDYSGNVTGPMLLPVLKNDFRPDKSPWHSIQNVQVSWKATKVLTVYAGVKNILNFIPKNPLMRPFDPFDKETAVNNPNAYTFDTSYNYAALQGIRAFAGLRCIIN